MTPEQWRGFTLVYSLSFGAVNVKAKNGRGETILETSGNDMDDARRRIRNKIDCRYEVVKP